MNVYQLAPHECPEDFIDARIRDLLASLRTTDVCAANYLDISTIDTPAKSIGRVDQFLSSGQAEDCFAIVFGHEAYYCDPIKNISLVAVVAISCLASMDDVVIEASVMPYSAIDIQALTAISARRLTLFDYAAQKSWSWINFSVPLLLEPVFIPKPWGQEIWYTGIEQRGCASIRIQDQIVPLPWLLSFLPNRLAAGNARGLTLLKVLDPLPDEVFGDLYFEMHTSKEEVYLVTDIDAGAWPSGRGGIQLGFCPRKRAELGNDQQFKTDYLCAVNAYKEVRIALDVLMDKLRHTEGIDLYAPVSALQQQSWLAVIAQDSTHKELLLREQRLRQHMYSFIAMQPLQRGDVVKIPCYVPHALQHGVRTVEFQNQSYERQILSFAQKVLTQSHWNTELALESIILDAPVQEFFQLLHDEAGVKIERVASFELFEVRRISAVENSVLQLNTDSYQLLMVIHGSISFVMSEQLGLYREGNTENSFSAGQAMLLPAGSGISSFNIDVESLLLLALPSVQGKDQLKAEI